MLETFFLIKFKIFCKILSSESSRNCIENQNKTNNLKNQIFFPDPILSLLAKSDGESAEF